MIQLNSTQAQNAVMGLTDFVIIASNLTCKGDFFAMRLWDMRDVCIWKNGQDILLDLPIDLTTTGLAPYWLPGLFFFGPIAGIKNGSTAPIVAYCTGTRQPAIIKSL